MTILSALAEVAAVTAFMVIVLAASYVLCERTGLSDRWRRHTQPDLTVRRPAESPTELYLRRQREQATAWQEVDR
jgi:hypothetical protein